MSILARFNPSYTKAITVTPSSSSASSVIGFGSKSMCFTNLSAFLTYVRISKGASTASIADYPILPNAQVWVSKDQDADTVSYITPSGASPSMHIMPGEGF